MDVLEWLNSSHHNTGLRKNQLELIKQAWQTSRQLTFEEIAEALEQRAAHKSPEVREAFGTAADLVRALQTS